MKLGSLVSSTVALFVITSCGGGGSGGANSPFAGIGKVGSFDCTYHDASRQHLFDVVIDIDREGRFVNGKITHRGTGEVMLDAISGQIGSDLSVTFVVKEGKVPGTSVHDIHRIDSNTQVGMKLIMDDGIPSGRCHVDLSAVEFNNSAQQFAGAYYRLSWR